jgi:hypothetical protein
MPIINRGYTLKIIRKAKRDTQKGHKILLDFFARMGDDVK